LIKYCPSCKQDAETYDTFKCSYCKQCWKAYATRYRANHKEVILENTRRSWHKNKDKYNLDRKLGGKTLYETKLEQQNNTCAICFKPEQSNRYKTLCVDHCHTTGKIRGLLCSNCNRALGLLKDDRGNLQSAINYLERHNNE